jgi:hypothetical protein
LRFTLQFFVRVVHPETPLGVNTRRVRLSIVWMMADAMTSGAALAALFGGQK